MTNKELLEKLIIAINEKFDLLNKDIQLGLKEIRDDLDKLITKEDMKELTNTIHLYMEMTRVYRDKQKELEKQIEAILEYLGISDN